MVQSFRPSFVTSTFPSETHRKQRYTMKHNAIQIALLFSCLIAWVCESPLLQCAMCAANNVSMTKWSRWWVSEGFYFILGSTQAECSWLTGLEKKKDYFSIWCLKGYWPPTTVWTWPCQMQQSGRVKYLLKDQHCVTYWHRVAWFQVSTVKSIHCTCEKNVCMMSGLKHNNALCIIIAVYVGCFQNKYVFTWIKHYLPRLAHEKQ